MADQKFPNEKHARLNLLAGVWKTEIVMLDEKAVEGERFEATDTYRWMPGGYFLLHDVDAVMMGEPVKSLEVIGVDASSGGYITRNYDNKGVVSDYKATLEDRIWKIQGEEERFKGIVDADGRKLTGRWERLEKSAWIPWMKVVLRKTSGN